MEARSGSFTCLNGVRALSLGWLILGHTIEPFGIPYIGILDLSFTGQNWSFGAYC